jgi:hypothetical protein
MITNDFSTYKRNILRQDKTLRDPDDGPMTLDPARRHASASAHHEHQTPRPPNTGQSFTASGKFERGRGRQAATSQAARLSPTVNSSA